MSFIGSYVLGMGFTFDDTDNKGVASSLAEMQRLIGQDPRNAERIFPYIGGEEVNDSPTHAHHRYVINFADYPLRREMMMVGEKALALTPPPNGGRLGGGRPEGGKVGAGSEPAPTDLTRPLPNPPPLGEGTKSVDALDCTWADADDKQREAWLRTGIVPLDYPGPVAADWPALLEIVERKVKPQRDQDNREIRKRYWWRFGENTPALFEAVRGLERVLVISRVGQQGAFTFKSSESVFAESMVVFPLPTDAAFGILQSRTHETWARFFASSMKDDMRYSPSDCFETFPFPLDYESNPDLETLGRDYYAYRAERMVKHNEGLTKTYNRFHDPSETAPDIVRLRELHTAMDRVVLDAYGWTDIPTDCVFLLDWEDEDEDEGGGRGSKRKKPWRYRWPDEVRDEVLARLLALNAERAAEEERAGQRAIAATPKPAKSGRKGGKPKPDNPNMELDF